MHWFEAFSTIKSIFMQRWWTWLEISVTYSQIDSRLQSNERYWLNRLDRNRIGKWSNPSAFDVCLQPTTIIIVSAVKNFTYTDYVNPWNMSSPFTFQRLLIKTVEKWNQIGFLLMSSSSWTSSLDLSTVRTHTGNSRLLWLQLMVTDDVDSACPH